ncbi:uncharacterized protein LOC111596077 [Drosophila hydei]|uniref:Uncharacterized protein LOC111596077 n=1 Tax=Drosophila hydei TaxID=7224 RepID=A0A6J1LJE5_DROHY|nr:uncharacterized protein LOC111596077 [Drosophila hydei]
MPLNFNVMRRHYEKRIKELEQQVLDTSRLLNILKKERSSALPLKEKKFINYMQTDTHFCWCFDMTEFPVGNIKVELRNRRVQIFAHRQRQDQFMVVHRQFQLPELADIGLTAKLSATGILTIKAPLRIIAD